jgi:hypothetical protein
LRSNDDGAGNGFHCRVLATRSATAASEKCYSSIENSAKSSLLSEVLIHQRKFIFNTRHLHLANILPGAPDL